ncbi:cellulase family glycosylhydrolase [Streptomyces sp. ODS28]|uniref:cellulase family glycosylhydrolase n=1 Tax=Streptomyces sp. ODS28 TaxID=3136688 RepID=UPI0031EB7D91
MRVTPHARPLFSALSAVAAAALLAPPGVAYAEDSAGTTASADKVSPAASAPAKGSPAPRWSTQGRWLTDERGRVVLTQGVNEVEKNPPHAPDAVGFGEDDAAFLQREGFTTVRLGVIWAAVEPRPGAYDDAYLARIRKTVEMLHRHGISALLDFHQDMVNPRFQGNGWPDWAVLDKGAPNLVKAGFPANYFLNAGVKNSYDSFYENRPASDGKGIADHYTDAWAHVAQQFRGTRGVMGFDLFNEPFPGNRFLGCLLPTGCKEQDARLSAVQQKAVDAIRRVDARTTVYYEPMQFFNIGIPTRVSLKGRNLAMSFHDYCTSQAVLHNYFGCKGPDAAVFANAEKQSRAHQQGLLLTEFGAITAEDVLRSQTDLAMKNKVGYQYWAYTGNDPTTAGPGDEQALVFNTKRPPRDGNVDWKKLDAVSVPHPDRVAGIPRDYGYDREARAFDLRYTPEKAGGGAFGDGSVTTVRIPAHSYPEGYRVRAEGARVTSGPDARTLRLELKPGAEEVRVSVRPTDG